MWRRNIATGITLAIAATGVSLSVADVPRTFSFQGRIAGYGDANVGLTVRLYDAPVGGNNVFTELHGTQLRDGVFSVAVGSVSGVPLNVVGALPVWASISIDGGPELMPRTLLQSVPFAFKALGSERLIVPGTFDTAAFVGSGGNVIFGDRVQIGAAADLGGVISVRNAANNSAVSIDGEEGSGAGRIELSNGAVSPVQTIVLDGGESGDSSCEMFDAGGFQAIRLHSDITNAAPEFSMFVGSASLPTRETVQIQANFDADSFGAGEVRLRRVDPSTQGAITTVQLAATSDNLQGQPNDGGELILSHANGTPVFTVHAGSGGALSPAYMQLDHTSTAAHLTASPNGLSMYDSSDNLTINLSGSTGGATFDGEVSVAVLNITGGSDLSERFDVAAGLPIEPGMVVSIDARNPGGLRLSDSSYDAAVAGVISGAGGIKPGMLMSQSGTLADGKHPVALTGRVWVKCDAADSAISPGDLLTTSTTAGHAMKAIDVSRRPGATIGKAMTSLSQGERGLVLVLVNLQ